MIEIENKMRKILEKVAEGNICDATYEECNNCILSNLLSSESCCGVAKEFLFLLDNQQKLYEKDFGYVFNPKAGQPTYRHFSLESAKAEAERLIATGIKADEIEILKIVDIAKVKQVLDWNQEKEIS